VLYKTVGCLSLYGSSRRALSTEEIEILGTLAHALCVEEERLANELSIKEFLDIASHELRHPITLMKGYALTLRDHGDRLEEGSWKELLDVINTNADRMDNLIKELLDISRIEGGRFILSRHRTSMDLLIKRAEVEMQGKGWDCSFTVSVEDDLPMLHLDPERILRVLIILMDNAGEHSPAGEAVTIRAEKSNGDILVSVIDRGVGVPGEDRERIFERFYQVRTAADGSSSGMGLGLYIAREIVEAHGGRIWQEPNPGGGSVFRFTLPRDTQD
jgi:signal transduction histidine kinase